MGWVALLYAVLTLESVTELPLRVLTLSSAADRGTCSLPCRSTLGVTHKCQEEQGLLPAVSLRAMPVRDSKRGAVCHRTHGVTPTGQCSVELLPPLWPPILPKVIKAKMSAPECS